jgi:hypothetical protein
MASCVVAVVVLAKEKLGKVAEDVKHSGTKETPPLSSFDRISRLAQHFADEALKTGQEYAQEGVKQGRKLSEKAFEVGKVKGNDLSVKTRPAVNAVSSRVFLANEALNSAKKAGQFCPLVIDAD